MRLPALFRLAALVAFWVALAGVLYMAFKPPGGPDVGIWDKAQHFIAFYILTTLGSAAYAGRKLWPLAAFLCLVGGGIELVQATPWIHRDAEFADWFADTVAIAAVIGPMCLPKFRTWLAR